jgi:hypothetical protein
MLHAVWIGLPATEQSTRYLPEGGATAPNEPAR